MGGLCGIYELWEVLLFHGGEGLRVGIFNRVGFTFSPSCLGTAVCCFLLCWLLGLLSFLSEPWYLGLLQLLHFLFTTKRSSDRQGHELDRVQRKKIANGFVFLPAAV